MYKSLDCFSVYSSLLSQILTNLLTLLHSLNDLLKSCNKWRWSKDYTLAFNEAKKLLVSAPVLAHFDLALPISYIVGDASAYGNGAIISHVFPNGEECPIAFSSRTLFKAEKKYKQINKEALSLMYSVQKFHQYLYEQKFVLVMDHKPLITLFGSKKGFHL